MCIVQKRKTYDVYLKTPIFLVHRQEKRTNTQKIEWLEVRPKWQQGTIIGKANKRNKHEKTSGRDYGKQPKSDHSGISMNYWRQRRQTIIQRN